MYPTYDLAKAKMADYHREAEQARRGRVPGSGRRRSRRRSQGRTVLRITRRQRPAESAVRVPRPRSGESGRTAHAA